MSKDRMVKIIDDIVERWQVIVNIATNSKPSRDTLASIYTQKIVAALRLRHELSQQWEE